MIRRMRLLPLALLSMALLSTGCAFSPTASSSGDTVSTAEIGEIHGSFHGGQQPIAGAHIFLFAANTTGYGAASLSLLKNVAGSTTLDSASGSPTNGDYYVTTASDGSFSITGDYGTCASGAQVYLYAVGGNPGSGTNSAAGGLAILGTCPSGGSLAASVPFVVINEVTTIAAAYSFAGFAVDATHVAGSSSTLAQTGVTTAFNTAANLNSLANGTALLTIPGNIGTAPQTMVNTLANILAACINSTGPGSSQCTTLLTNARSGGSTGTTPTETATAAINIAHNPGNAVPTLFALQSSTPPFQPALSTAPVDLNLVISYTPTGLSRAIHVAVDPGGQVWIMNDYSTPPTYATLSNLFKLSSTGTLLSGTGYTDYSSYSAGNLAIDMAGNAWITHTFNDSHGNCCSGSLAKFGNDGTYLAAVGGGGLDAPFGLAFDMADNVWVGNGLGNCGVSKFTNAGFAISPSTPANTTGGGGYGGAGLNCPTSLAFDASNNLWATNAVYGSVSKLNDSAGAISSSTGFTGGGLYNDSSVAIDSSGNAWAIDQPQYSVTTGAISKLSSNGTVLSPSTGYVYATGFYPQQLVMDGSSTPWIAAVTGIVRLSNSGTLLTPVTGYTGGTSGTFDSLSIDTAGNIWIGTGSSNIFEMVGAATPVAPVATALGLGQVGARP